MATIISKLSRSPSEEKGYYVYYIRDEGFYVKRGTPSEIFKKLPLQSVNLLEIGHNLDQDFRVDYAFKSFDEAIHHLNRSVNLAETDKPVFRRRKPLVIKRFAGKWEIRVLYYKLSDGGKGVKPFPVGKANPSKEKVEYLTFENPKELRKHTDNYIPVFRIKK